jgi:hypothetical protein
LDFTAEHRAALSVRIISTLPSPLLGWPADSPERTALAAASASMGSDLPPRRKWRLFGRSTSSTSTPQTRT